MHHAPTAEKSISEKLKPGDMIAGDVHGTPAKFEVQSIDRSNAVRPLISGELSVEGKAPVKRAFAPISSTELLSCDPSRGYFDSDPLAIIEPPQGLRLMHASWRVDF